MEISAIKAALLSRAEDVCRHLLPGGKVEKGDWICSKDDRLNDGSGGHSLHIGVSGKNAGVFKDFGGTAEGSNLLELWVQARGMAFQDARTEAEKWLAERGVVSSDGIRRAAPANREYAKPTRKGLTKIVSRAEAYLTGERGIPPEIVTLYRCCSTSDGDAIVFPYLHETAPHEPQMLKFLKIDRDEHGKKHTWTSANTAKVLFGKHTCRPADRILIICEGEIDAMSWRALDIPNVCVVSVPFGAKWEGKDGKDPNDEWIANDWDFINRFECVYTSMDPDEEGRKATASIVKRIGLERCYIINLPQEGQSDKVDPNQLLQQGDEIALRQAFDEAKPMDPATLKNSSHFRDKVLDLMYSQDAEAQRGIPLPFGKYPFHLRWNEWTVITGQNGAGKSQLIGYLFNWLGKLGYPGCYASLEVPAELTVRYMASQAIGAKLPPREDTERALDWMATWMWMYDHVGETKLPDVLSAFRYAYRRYGVKFFAIDSAMKLGISAEDLDAQNEACNDISNFVKDCDAHLFVVVHPRKLQNTTQWMTKMDVKGSGEFTDQAHNVLIAHRNYKKEKAVEQMVKMKDDEVKIDAARRAKPDMYLEVGKQRNDEGDLPTIDLWIVKDAKQFHGWPKNKGVNLLATDQPAEAPPEPTAADNGDMQIESEDVPF